ncbi:NAD(P)-dependent alcohol dehydrogenase [Microbacterium horticulturae]|uniref:NAD(P)-dependent alcohol dehydrogenase n=1 Tax=Microbacterium horticulturae TaxID=3028316 RepID=A0ABY8BYJ8_9MICO|nr:NAD(P)-dependent alcohol dehydrogenase [Microbacterium sp. KACC 23027]WEG09279.1 NAD(P)-dependent alcohol dehydrogenase [Microbacterium sp. KACC 23027]
MSIPQTMRAAVLVRPGEIRIQEREVPAPGPDEVLVEVSAVGVCGSDVHFYKEGRLGDWVVDEPLVLGHESGGHIVAVGRDVAPHRIGERVSIEPQHPSPSSAETLRGDYNLDPHMRFYAVPGTDGAFCQYVTIQGHFAHPVPDNVSDGAAALLEPLSVAIAAGRKAELGLGSRVLVTGAGPVGLAVAQVARAAGAVEVLITDISAERRAAALRFGATAALDPAADAAAVATAGVDAFIDASGAGAAVRAGLEALRPAGRAVLVGMGLAELPFPVTHIQNNELVVTGVFRYANTWPTAVAMAATGMVDLDAMITGAFPLAQTAAAMESTTAPGTIKSVVEPQH